MPLCPSWTSQNALPCWAHIGWGGIKRGCWVGTSVVTHEEYLIQNKETGNFQSNSHYLQCENNFKGRSKFRSPKQSSLNFTAKHTTEKLTQTATARCLLPSPFNICVRISIEASFPFWMASLLWSMHCFPTRLNSLTLSLASFSIFCFPGMNWIQNFFCHFISFAGKK